MELVINEIKTEFMPIDEINSNVLSHYNFEVYEIENIKFKDTDKQRAVYKVNTSKGLKCLKKVYYNEPTLLFIYSIIEWLNVKGVLCPRLNSTKKGLKYINYNNNLFILTDWVNGRKCNYDIKEDVIRAAENLGKIHKQSKGFIPIEGSVIRHYNTNFYQSYNKHFLQLLELSNSAFIIKDKFSKIYLENFDYNLEKARESVYLLSQIDFTKPLGDEVSNYAICHLDYVNKNIIFSDDNKLHVIDFDNTQMDIPIHDVAGFLKRIMKRTNTSWDFDLFIIAIESYEKARALSLDEHIALLALLMFPQKFWRISRDYFKNRRKCNKDSFITIIQKINEQSADHDEFCKKYKRFIRQRFNMS
jgi:CotS family spore coat protein